MRSIVDIKNALADGTLAREEFWAAMRERHLLLREYQQLVGSTELSAIEIVADELRVVTTDGLRLVWHPEDLRTAPNVLVNTGEYEPAESAALKAAAAGASVIFDIGANVGYFSLRWATGMASSGSIHAFEPVPATYDRLARNVALNGLGDVVRTNNLGVGNHPGTFRFHVPSFSGSGAASLMNLHPDEDTMEVEAEVTTLDAYFAEHGLNRLDLVKVDVEGAELMVLHGGSATIAHYKPLLFLELLRKWSKPFGYHPNDVIALLGGMGYRCYVHEGERLVRFETMTDETVQTNFFFADPAKHAKWLQANGVAG